MRRLRIITFVCFLLAAALLAASTVHQRMTRDDTLPVVECPQEPLVLSVKDGEEVLLEGVTAYDEKDGDLTDRVMLQGVAKTGDTAVATYAVVDGDDHVATCSRELHYTDYTPPRFALSRELRYTEGTQIRIKDRLTASDVVDGDISGRIKVTSGGLTDNAAGVYPAAFEVTNSMGDTASITMDIVVRNYEPGEPQIRLTEYLVYRSAGEAFDPMTYLDSVSGGSAADVRAQLPAGGLAPGMSQVTYTCEGVTGVTGSVILYVVTE